MSFFLLFLDPIIVMLNLKRALKHGSLLALLFAAGMPQSSFGQVASYKLFESGHIRVDKSASTSIVSPQARFVVDKTALSELRRSSTIEVREVPLFVAGTDDVKLVDLELTEFSVLSPDAILTVTTHDGLAAGPLPTVKLYRGKVRGDEASTAYLALGTNEITGRISTAEGDFSVGYEVASDKSLSAVIVDVRSIPSSLAFGQCEVTDDNRYTPYGIKQPTPANPKQARVKPQGAAAVAAEMAFECDFETYEHFGSNEQTVTDWLVARLGAITTVYENELGCALQLANLNIFKVADPYPTVGGIDPLLQAFTTYWQQNKTAVRRTLAHLVSRQAFDNPNYSSGLAWVDGMCRKDIGYAVTRVWGSEQFPTLDDGVMAHEIGHNFGSQHTHNCQQWGVAIDSCVAAEGTCFSGTKQVKGTIMSYCNDKSFTFGKRVQDFLITQIEAAQCLVPTGTEISNITLLSNNVPISGVKVDQSKDTTIVGFFKNNASKVLSVMSATMTGSSDFEIVEPSLPLAISARKTGNLTIRFTPSSEDVQSAAITFALEGTDPVATLNLTGSTTPSGGGNDNKPLGFSAAGRKIEWGEKKVGATNDTIVKVTNKTNATISTLQPKWDPTTNTAFTIVGSKLLTIPAGGQADLKISFKAPANKQYAAKLIIPFGTGQDTLTLTGTGSFNPGGGAGVEAENALGISLSASPNPFISAVSIDLALTGGLTGKQMTIEVFNVLGTSMGMLYDAKISSEKLNLSWKPEGVDAGTYYVVARVDDAVLTRKIIYKH
jgi:hypothetical protein